MLFVCDMYVGTSSSRLLKVHHIQDSDLLFKKELTHANTIDKIK
jgi:hypothetical protein